MCKKKLVVYASAVLILFAALTGCCQAPKPRIEFLGERECVAKADSLEFYKVLLREAEAVISDYLENTYDQPDE